MQSLRRRAILGGIVWAGIAILLGGIALYYVLDGQVQRRFDDGLSDRYIQVVAALGNSSGDAELLESYLTDPLYQRPYSGRYWQIRGPDESTIVSRSLFDVLLPVAEPLSTDPETWTVQGPDGPMRGIGGLVRLEDGTNWSVSVAESLASITSERSQIRRSLLTTFALIGVLGIAATVVQTSLVLSPLNRLRQEVTRRWDRGEALEPADYPEEVAPLVSDIRALLDRNREMVERGRRQAADLAHALKTPAAILRNELDALAQSGMDVADAQTALTRVDAQLMRSLARIRAATSGADALVQTDLLNSANRMARLFRTGADGMARQFEIDVPADLRIRMDQQDLEEILGNTVENAFKWSRRTVRLTARPMPDGVELRIDDDGPGIPEESRREALRSGGRLDVSMPGTGLGLAIVSDLVAAYGGTLDLEASDLFGGLRVRIGVPAQFSPGG
ncbi:MAG TPA: HAMP domain-containing sensor histidine kinase [Albidovulum sp.]|uniref:sensor histidine kinase n=1 Tax=Albidovulum sp. TaxID=1872424 RepID=UPI002C5CF892|nr:HAMP domain-containing sensor histidine kinase [Albidovulum sp.]